MSSPGTSIPADMPRALWRNDALLAVAGRWAPRLSLIAVVVLALALDSWRLADVGFGNTYYAAAVRSMTLSWRNFFFGAFDPGGFITVDKLPAFLWAGALSARTFGYSSWSILLPSAVAGAATVGLLWLIVRRWFGAFAATVAALVLALTPITVAVDRLNLPEPFFILELVGAAGAVLCALAATRTRAWVGWSVLAGALVGLAFNTKMLAAWIPGPALVLALAIGVPWPAWRVEGAASGLGGWIARWRATARPFLGRIVIFGMVSLAVSLSWMAAADLTPADARPYIGGSTDNRVSDLVLGYNGFGRVEGNAGFGGPPGGGAAPRAPLGAPAGVPRDGGPQRGPALGVTGGANGPGGIIAGQPGAWRMLDAANGNQIAWLLPFGLLGGVVALWARRREPLPRAAIVAFLGWVLLYAAVFSFARGIYHSYYTSALAPGIAALAGIGGVTIADLVRRDRRWLVALLVVVGATVAMQLQLSVACRGTGVGCGRTP